MLMQFKIGVIERKVRTKTAVHIENMIESTLQNNYVM